MLLVVLVIKDEAELVDCVRRVDSFDVVYCVKAVVFGKVVGSVVVVVSDSDAVVLCVIDVCCGMVEVIWHNTTLNGMSLLAKRHVEQEGTSMKMLHLLRKQPSYEVSIEYALHDE